MTIPKWILTPIEDYHTCGICGALIWVKGEGLLLHKVWHAQLDSLTAEVVLGEPLR